MTHIYQGATTDYCGQASLAMISGRPLKDVFKIVGHRKGTRLLDIVDYARKLGLSVPNVWHVPLDDEPLPKNALVRMRRKRAKHGHIIAVIDGVVHDPACKKAGQL